MATKAGKNGKKAAAPKKELSKAEILEKEISELEDQQCEIPIYEDLFIDCDLVDQIKALMKAVPKEHKASKTKIDTTSFVQKAQAFLNAIKDLDKKVFDLDKASNNLHKSLQKQIDSKRKLLQKEKPQTSPGLNFAY